MRTGWPFLRPIIKRILGLFIIGHLLSACASLPSARSIAISDRDRSILQELKAWVLQGRLGIRTEHDAWQASLDWQHLAGEDRLNFSGPFGQGALTISVKPTSVRITDGDGNSEISDDPEQALIRRFGFNIPISALSFWVLGLAEPGVEASQEYDDEGKLKRIVYQGWDVQFLKYMIAADLVIPKKIHISHAAVKLKLIVDYWQKGV